MAAARAPERMTFAQYQALPPEQRAIYDRFRGASPRGDNTAVTHRAMNDLTETIARLEGSLVTTPAAQRGPIQELIRQSRARLVQLQGGLDPILEGAAGSNNDPLGIRR